MLATAVIELDHHLAPPSPRNGAELPHILHFAPHHLALLHLDAVLLVVRIRHVPHQQRGRVFAHAWREQVSEIPPVANVAIDLSVTVCHLREL